MDEVKLPRVSKGKRPSFFEDPAIDQVMTFFLELVTEVSTLRERMDSIERLLEKKGSITRSEIEDFLPDQAGELERVAWCNSFIRRVMRLHDQS